MLPCRVAAAGAGVPAEALGFILVFLSGALVLSTSMMTSYADLREGWIINLAPRHLTIASALPVAARQPMYDTTGSSSWPRRR